MLERVPHRARSLRRVVAWALSATLVWVVLVDAETRTAWLGAVVIAAAVVSGLALAPDRRTRVSALGVVRFLPRFLLLSLAGAVDVSLRAFRGRGAIHPGVLYRESRLDPSSPALTMLALVVTLVPGTLCVDIEGRRLTLHVVDVSQDTEATLTELEDLIARIFPRPPAEARS